jgi:hypothetical protein
MKIKLITLMKTKFKISNPRQVLKELKQIADIPAASLRKPFEETPPERFDLEVIKNYIVFVNSFGGKKGIIYQPEYWMYRFNISYEEGLAKVNEYKKNKSTSKTQFIRRHGEKVGLEMFEKFQKTSSFSTSDEWFKQKYGEAWGEEKRKSMARRSKWCVDHWIEKGYTIKEAEEKVADYQRNNSGVHKDYYRNLGYSEEEIDVIFQEIKKKQTNHHRNTKYLKEKYPDCWREIYCQVSEKYRLRMEELGLWIVNDLIDDFRKYRSLVARYTNESIILFGNFVENLDLRSRNFHLDHKYSIKMGFLNDIDPKIIGSVVNFEIVPAKVNLNKKAKCSISKTQLLKNYKEFKESYEN